MSVVGLVQAGPQNIVLDVQLHHRISRQCAVWLQQCNELARTSDNNMIISKHPSEAFLMYDISHSSLA
jgi:hypothetical protein